MRSLHRLTWASLCTLALLIGCADDDESDDGADGTGSGAGGSSVTKIFSVAI